MGNPPKSLIPGALAENMKTKTLQATRVPERERLPQQRSVVPHGGTAKEARLDNRAGLNINRAGCTGTKSPHIT